MKLLKKIFSVFKSNKCSCDYGDYKYIKETRDNKVYKCLTCGGKEYKLYYRGGVMGLNPRLSDFYYRKTIRELRGDKEVK